MVDLIILRIFSNLDDCMILYNEKEKSRKVFVGLNVFLLRAIYETENCKMAVSLSGHCWKNFGDLITLCICLIIVRNENGIKYNIVELRYCIGLDYFFL